MTVSTAPGATDNGIGVVAALHFQEWATNVSICRNALTRQY